MTDNENALIAYALLDEVNAFRGRLDDALELGARPDQISAEVSLLTADIARAQVYATLATVPARPSQEALQDVIYDTLRARDADAGLLDAGAVAEAAAEAVGRLL